jgi:hypothetical protein
MNMPWFGMSFYEGADGSLLWPAWWDRTIDVAQRALLGQFNARINAVRRWFHPAARATRGARPAACDSDYLRRTGWLFVFGAACVF